MVDWFNGRTILRLKSNENTTSSSRTYLTDDCLRGDTGKSERGNVDVTGTELMISPGTKEGGVPEICMTEVKDLTRVKVKMDGGKVRRVESSLQWRSPVGGNQRTDPFYGDNV